MINITVCDNKLYNGYPQKLDFMPNLTATFLWRQGEYREIKEVHQTSRCISREQFLN